MYRQVLLSLYIYFGCVCTICTRTKYMCICSSVINTAKQLAENFYKVALIQSQFYVRLWAEINNFINQTLKESTTLQTTLYPLKEFADVSEANLHPRIQFVQAIICHIMRLLEIESSGLGNGLIYSFDQKSFAGSIWL